MRHWTTQIALAATVLLAPCALRAQTDQITGGYAVISLTSALSEQLAASGTTLTDLNGNSLPNGVLALPLVQGVVDLQKGSGDMVFKNGYRFTTGSTTIRVEDLQFVTTSTSATFSGNFVVNGSVLGRQDIFTVNQQPNYSFPLQVTNGTLALPQLSLGLAPAFLALINQDSGQQQVTAATQVATVTFAPVVIPEP